MLLREIIHSIELVAPRSAQEEWDNSGMQVGDTGRDIQSVLLTTDVTEDVVNEAIMLGCDLIVSHHPLLFRGLKQVCGQTPQARVVELAIKHNIAIYSAHTNLDSVIGGINTKLAERLGITGGGSGAEFIETAIEQGADVYVTADCKYHEFQDAAGRIGLVDIDHWISEHHATEIFRDIIAPLGVKCNISKQDKTPILLWQEQKN